MVYSTWCMNIRILQIMVSGIHHVLGLRARMSDPCVYVVFAVGFWGRWLFGSLWDLMTRLVTRHLVIWVAHIRATRGTTQSVVSRAVSTY